MIPPSEESFVSPRPLDRNFVFSNQDIRARKKEPGRNEEAAGGKRENCKVSVDLTQHGAPEI